MRMLPPAAHRSRALLVLACALCLPALPRAYAATDLAGPPILHARSAILLEATTGTVLYQLNADQEIAPASLTKLMTLHIALSEVEAGRLDPDEWVVPGPHAWARSQLPGSSLMLLGPDQRVSIRQLLEGLIVASGNDAAVAIAERIAGSVAAFVALMNGEAERLGFRVMHFSEPAGLDPANAITAREYAEFCRIFIEMHPEALRTIFSLRKITYPLPENLVNGSRQDPMTQENRNSLLGRYEGIDGLKTGFIEESGYHMAATALRDGMRLISVVLGVPDTGGVSGETLRATDSASLLDYGFDTFVTIRPSFDPPAAVKIWKGRLRFLVPVVRPPIVTVRRDQAARVTTSLEQSREILAPVRAARVLGQLTARLDGLPIASFPVKAGIDVDRAGFLRRAVDSIVLLFRGFFGYPPPASAAVDVTP